MANKTNHHLREFAGRGTVWAHVGDASAANLRELSKRLDIHEHDLRDVLPALQHTKCIVRPQYLFMVLIFPFYDRNKRVLRETELDIFLNAKTLITVNHGNEIRELTEMADAMTNAAKRELVLSQTPAEVAINLIENIYKSIYPLLVQHTRDITAVENSVFDEAKRADTIRKILQLKTSNGRARKAMQNHKNTLLVFKAALPQFSQGAQHEHISNVINRTIDIWNTLKSQRESIDSIHTTNATLLSFRINSIMKTLTVFSVIIFPLTLLATIFCMRTAGLPFLNDPNGFWYIIGAMFTVTLVMLGIFKAKRWL